MKKIYVGIDISKEKCNLCYRSGLEIVHEEECSNEVKTLKKDSIFSCSNDDKIAIHRLALA